MPRTAPRVDAVGDATSLADRKRAAGQRIVLGFHGTSVGADLRALVREIRPAGFVLFARNVEEPAQVRELNRELSSLVDPSVPPLRCVDQEGGRVQRVRSTPWPAMRQLGRAPELLPDVARAIARELRAMEFDLDFAPVADVDSNPNNPVIGDRSFGARSEDVSRHVAAFVGAMQAEGIAACAKHFPGHGDTATDSHHDLPVVERDPPDVRAVELPPFRAAVEAGVASVMTAHVVFSAWDDEWPATLSERVVPPLLRTEMRYDGLVFSDDLDMKAVAGRWPVDRIVRRATAATVDVFPCCQSAALQQEVFETLVRAQEDDAAFEEATVASAARVAAVRDRFLKRTSPPPPLEAVGCAEHHGLARRVAARAGVA